MGEFSLQALVFVALKYPIEALMHADYMLCFWVVVFGTIYMYSAGAALAVLMGAGFAILATCGKAAPKLPRYSGPFDVFLGRKYRASTQTVGQPANNNVSLTSFGDKLVLAYRKADTHFASPHAKIIVASSSTDDLEKWSVVWEYTTGQDDLREMFLFQMSNTLFLYFARLEPHRAAFTPLRTQWTSTADLKVWSIPLDVGRVSEIVWDIKLQKDGCGKDVAYKVSYTGTHYSADAVCDVLFEQSTDGFSWSPVGEKAEVYTGGVCEVSFAFTSTGDLVAIGRNEDGDKTGFGSQLFFARAGDLGNWQHLSVSLPSRFDSPRLERLGDELVLFARYAATPYSWVPTWMPFGLQRVGNLLMYSCLPKSAAVYRITPPDAKGNFDKQPVEIIRHFEDTHGDTGFFSLACVEGSEEDFVIANYSSTCHSHAPWIYGQAFATDIYVCRLKVVRESKRSP